MDDPLRLSELLSSRLNHQISGLLGTLLGTLELARETAAVASEALDAAVETGAEMNLRLQLLREAWAGGGTPLDLAQLDELASGLPGSHRLAIDLSGLAAETVLRPPMARIVLNVLLLAAESLPHGGVITLAGTRGTDILVTITGLRAAWPAGLAVCLADEAAAWAALAGPRALLGPLVSLLARRHSVRISLLLPSGDVPSGRGRRTTAAPLLLSQVEAG